MGRQDRYSPVRGHSARRVNSIVTCTCCSYCAYNGELIFGTTLLSTACAERVILTFPPPGPSSNRHQDKSHGKYKVLIEILVVTQVYKQFGGYFPINFMKNCTLINKPGLELFNANPEALSCVTHV